MEKMIKPTINTLEMALGEYTKNGKVGTVHCERCNGLIEITRKSESTLSVKCECGLYNDNLRGL